MSDFSRTPLFKKLGLKDGLRADIENAPDDLFDLLHGMPDHIDWDDESDELDFLLSFHPDLPSFQKEMDSMLTRVKETGGWWIGTKKGQKKSPTRLSGNEVREILRPMGYVDVKVCSVNDVWTAVKYMKRKS